MKKNKANRTNPDFKTGKQLEEVYVHGTKEPVAAVDELHNLYHKPSDFEVEQGKIYIISSSDQTQSHYWEQKYKRKETLIRVNGKVEQILGDSWYWNWNNMTVRQLHFRVMNFTLPYDYHKVWYGEVLKGTQTFPELIFQEELRETDALELDALQKRDAEDEAAMVATWEKAKKEKLEKEGVEGLKNEGGEFLNPEDLAVKK